MVGRKILIGVVAMLFGSSQGPGADLATTTAQAIREEATRPNDSEEGRPLPLACSWQCGHYTGPTCAG